MESIRNLALFPAIWYLCILPIWHMISIYWDKNKKLVVQRQNPTREHTKDTLATNTEFLPALCFFVQSSMEMKEYSLCFSGWETQIWINYKSIHTIFCGIALSHRCVCYGMNYRSSVWHWTTNWISPIVPNPTKICEMKPTLLHVYILPYTSTMSRSFVAYLHHCRHIRIL